MNTMPAIMVSTLDRERLYALLDNIQEESDQAERLYEELDRAQFIDPKEMPDDIVTLGCRLRFRNENTGKEHERVLTLPEQARNYNDAISILSPAGAALLGLKVGDEIKWPLGDGQLRLRLLDVIRD
ncbi:MAG: nucleoside diphosphate kinase regulator [Gammaproteobacteria bacterium]|nr:nucleoside diphosphate kinase regulator [Gammaproteobacteria bacterium]MBQ0775630.1 nucleoside diphosphate kinase regulator [Gammaproteobacteria bacterium]